MSAVDEIVEWDDSDFVTVASSPQSQPEANVVVSPVTSASKKKKKRGHWFWRYVGWGGSSKKSSGAVPRTPKDYAEGGLERQQSSEHNDSEGQVKAIIHDVDMMESLKSGGHSQSNVAAIVASASDAVDAVSVDAKHALDADANHSLDADASNDRSTIVVTHDEVYPVDMIDSTEQVCEYLDQLVKMLDERSATSRRVFPPHMTTQVVNEVNDHNVDEQDDSSTHSSMPSLIDDSSVTSEDHDHDYHDDDNDHDHDEEDWNEAERKRKQEEVVAFFEQLGRDLMNDTEEVDEDENTDAVFEGQCHRLDHSVDASNERLCMSSPATPTTTPCGSNTPDTDDARLHFDKLATVTSPRRNLWISSKRRRIERRAKTPFSFRGARNARGATDAKEGDDDAEEDGDSVEVDVMQSSMVMSHHEVMQLSQEAIVGDRLQSSTEEMHDTIISIPSSEELDTMESGGNTTGLRRRRHGRDGRHFQQLFDRMSAGDDQDNDDEASDETALQVICDECLEIFQNIGSFFGRVCGAKSPEKE